MSQDVNLNVKLRLAQMLAEPLGVDPPRTADDLAGDCQVAVSVAGRVLLLLSELGSPAELAEISSERQQRLAARVEGLEQQLAYHDRAWKRVFDLVREPDGSDSNDSHPEAVSRVLARLAHSAWASKLLYTAEDGGDDREMAARWLDNLVAGGASWPKIAGLAQYMRSVLPQSSSPVPTTGYQDVVSGLVACPFCGGEEIKISVPRESGEGYFAECDGCGSMGPTEDSADDALRSWSRRRAPGAGAVEVGAGTATPRRPDHTVREAVLVPSSSPDLEGGAAPSARGVHHLKSWPRFFQQVVDGSKSFEVRLDDRGFTAGDEVYLHEWDPSAGASREASGYTGRDVRGEITCVLTSAESEGKICHGHVVLGIEWRP